MSEWEEEHIRKAFNHGVGIPGLSGRLYTVW